MITQLIDKKDSFEVIGDQIAAILATETANQQSLASAKGKDPAEWAFRVFQERTNPFEEFNNENADLTPIVNVWYDSSTFDYAGSDYIQRQKTVGLFNIDCFAAGNSVETGEGHQPGDLVAALEMRRVIRLVRNILHASDNTYLQLRGHVWSRRVESVNIFQPQAENADTNNISGARIVFRVEFNELSPQYEAEILELLTVQVKRAETGEVLLNAEYHYNGQ